MPKARNAFPESIPIPGEKLPDDQSDHRSDCVVVAEQMELAYEELSVSRLQVFGFTARDISRCEITSKGILQEAQYKCR